MLGALENRNSNVEGSIGCGGHPLRSRICSNVQRSLVSGSLEPLSAVFEKRCGRHSYPAIDGSSSCPTGAEDYQTRPVATGRISVEAESWERRS